MHRRTCVALCGLLAIMSLLSCARANRFDPGLAVTKFFEAWDLRQAQVVRDMLADDVEMELLGHTYKGKDEVVQFMAFDDGMRGSLEVANVAVKGDTVTLDLLESNEFMAALGVPQVRNHLRVVFADRKLKRTSGLGPAEGDEQLEAAWAEFEGWVQSNHPEALAAMYGEDGAPVISREAGQALVELAKQWRAATHAP
jgi:hypothetical protein